VSSVRRWRLLADEDDAERELRGVAAGAAERDAVRPLAWPWVAAILAIAAAPRLVYVFFVGQPENAGDGMYSDVYHHWQIAYLTQQIGVGHGFRLWDLKGMEYFWGVLHPWLLAALFTITGSTSIVIARLVSTAFGCLTVLLIFLLCRRHWGLAVAIPAAAFAAFAPTSVFNDASGMLEPIGIALCLLGIWLLPRHPFLAGAVWGLASMARAEAWLFTVGLVVATVLYPATRRQSLTVAIAWGAVMLGYMKILLDQTGNPIYPLFWNFFADAVGWWETAPRLTPQQEMVRPVLGVLLVLAAGGLVWTLARRPRGYLLLTFGFGYWVFVAGMLGFTAYLKSWVGWDWVTRYFVFPYDFAAILASIGLFHLLPRALGSRYLAPAVAVAAAALIAVQAVWPWIQTEYNGTFTTWDTTVAVGEHIGAVYQRPGIAGGMFAVPADHPNLTYTLAQYGRLPGRHLLSELYDPFYYLPAGTTYADHRADVGTLLQCWLSQTRTTMLAVDDQRRDYRLYTADHPEWFTPEGTVPQYGWTLYRVQVPEVPAADCRNAYRALTAP
jgi:hypothetical protein